MKKKLKIIFTVGLQCSGKTTWAANICKKDSNHFRVSLDDIRLMRGQYWLPDDESIVVDSAAFLSASALSNGKTVIFDAMNLSPESRKGYLNHIEGHLLNLVDDYELEVVLKRFTDVPLVELFRRCGDRDDSRGIDERIIMETYGRHKDILPKNLVQRTSERVLPKAVLVDVDGTIANKGSRNPFDWKSVGEDTPHLDIINLLTMFAKSGYEVIFMSGRDSVCIKETKEWLDRCVSGGYLDLGDRPLFMREEADQRKDSVVKFELYMKNVINNWDVEYVLDDRDQVVSMWRNVLNLRCLQVAEGNF